MSELHGQFIVPEIFNKAGGEIRRASRSYGKGDNFLVIENVPVVSCPHCGESYLTAAVLHEIERIKSHRRAMAQERPAPVTVFA
jgi:YgiT-type zinc finger domain-containing protein